MYAIGEELKDFLHSGVAVQTGTADAAGKPQIAMGWGPRVNEDGSLTLFLDTARAGRSLANLVANPTIAVVFADPVSYRSVQLKGRWVSTSRPAGEDEAWVMRHRELFATSLALIGDTRESIRNMWMEGVTRIDLSVEQAFDQTPGPAAGAPL